MKGRRFGAVLTVLAVGLAAVLCGGAQAAKSTYVIGAVFDVTGPASPLGTPE